MPNYCEADLVVKGNIGEIIRFKEFAKEGDNLLSTDKFIPYPTEFKELDAKAKETRELADAGKISADEAWKVKDGFNSGGYEWCCKHWGTKWGIFDTRITKETAGAIYYSMRTAWSPALPVIQRMSELFPSLKFSLRYFEMGAGFKGKFVCKGGVMLANDYSENYKGNRGG